MLKQSKTFHDTPNLLVMLLRVSKNDPTRKTIEEKLEFIVKEEYLKQNNLTLARFVDDIRIKGSGTFSVNKTYSLFSSLYPIQTNKITQDVILGSFVCSWPSGTKFELK